VAKAAEYQKQVQGESRQELLTQQAAFA